MEFETFQSTAKNSAKDDVRPIVNYTTYSKSMQAVKKQQKSQSFRSTHVLPKTNQQNQKSCFRNLRLEQNRRCFSLRQLYCECSSRLPWKAMLFLLCMPHTSGGKSDGRTEGHSDCESKLIGN